MTVARKMDADSFMLLVLIKGRIVAINEPICNEEPTQWQQVARWWQVQRTKDESDESNVQYRVSLVCPDIRNNL